MATQEALRASWLEGTEERLCGREQAKAWALREVWREEGKPLYGMLAFVAARVRKGMGGEAKGAHLTHATLQQFFVKVDGDLDWFLGKHNASRRGPKRILSGAKRTAIAASAKRLTNEGCEPTYNAIGVACPLATRKPNTGEPVDKSQVHAMFREGCYDEGPADRWGHLARFTRRRPYERLAFAV